MDFDTRQPTSLVFRVQLLPKNRINQGSWRLTGWSRCGAIGWGLTREADDLCPCEAGFHSYVTRTSKT
jgi:hypothetical protein